jgi:hypothetical protein
MGFGLLPFSGGTAISCLETRPGSGYYEVELPNGFDFQAPHLIRLEADGVRARAHLDGIQHWQGRLAQEPDQALLFTDRRAARFCGFELTLGWRDLSARTIHFAATRGNAPPQESAGSCR